MKMKRPNNQNGSEKKNKVPGVRPSNFKFITKLRQSGQYVQYWHTDEEVNATEQHPETDPHIHSQPIFDQGAKAVQWRKESLFNKKYENNWTSSYAKQKQTQKPPKL